jgi:Holliday junction resolvase RusA-like endonuclease
MDKISFFMPMIPPTKTHQQKKVAIRNGKPIFYEPRELQEARVKLREHLSQHVPTGKFITGVRLVTKWLFPITGKHVEGEYKITKPDTDNLQKMLKDVMTDVGYWVDDALVCSEIIEKFYADKPGIYISIEEM